MPDLDEQKYVRVGESTDTDLIIKGPQNIIVNQVVLDFEETFTLPKEPSLYQSEEPTNLQFNLENINEKTSIIIPYRNRLTHTEAKYASIYYYDIKLKRWEAIKFYHTQEEKVFECEVAKDGYLVVFTNTYWYSTITQKLADEYPQWTRIRKYKESIGQQFLNFYGMNFEEVESWLNWIDDQKHLTKTDVHVLDWVYVYPLIEVKQNDIIQLFYQKDSQTHIIPIIEDIKGFFNNDTNQGGMIDYEERRFYSKSKIDEIRGIVRNENGIKEFKSNPIPYHIWNTFDEFGLLLNVKRLHLENNKDFKERLLDVFRYPANSSNTGIGHGIARELNLIKRTNEKELLWENDQKSLLIHNRSGLPIDIESLRVDYQPLNDEQYEVLDNKHILIHPLRKYQKHIISFIYGLDKHELHNKNDIKLQKMMFQENGQATGKLIDWVSYINTVAPIMWNRFKWDEGYWDTVSKELSGLGYIPNMWDSDISIWKDYKFLVNRWEDEQIWK